jgi:hypothetical protein
MLQITKPAENRIVITLDGDIGPGDMDRALDDLVSLSEGMENGQMLYFIRSFTMPGFDAMGVKLSRLPELLRLITGFDRCAVVTDQGWIRTGAAIEGALIPGIDIKGFAPEQEQQAEDWLNHVA